MTTTEATDEYLISLFEEKKKFSERNELFYINKKDLVEIKNNPNVSQRQKESLVPFASTYITKLNQQYANERSQN
jgi:ribosomal 30S subunit maturation factor RimM